MQLTQTTTDKVAARWGFRFASMPMQLKMWDGKLHPVNRKVWVWFEKKAKADKTWAEEHEFAANPDAWPASTISIGMLKERLNKSLDEMTLDSYKYFWWRSHLNGGPMGSMVIDPAARKDWEKITGEDILPEDMVNLGDAPRAMPEQKIKYKRMPRKAEAEVSPLMAYIGKKDRLVPHILKTIKDVGKQDSWNKGTPREIQQGINGFIQDLFAEIQGGAPLAQKLWRLFEASGISQASALGRKVVMEYRRYFTGPASTQLLQAAAVSLDLLRRGRMPNLMARVEDLLQNELKTEMAGAPAPSPSAVKSLTPVQVLKKMVAERIPLVRGYISAFSRLNIELDIVAARKLVAEVLEDANWHSLSSTLSRMTPGIDNVMLPDGLAAQIAQAEEYSINYLAVEGIAILSLVEDKEGINVLKQAVLSQFPETFLEND